MLEGGQGCGRIGRNIIVGDRKPVYKDSKDYAAEVKGAVST